MRGLGAEHGRCSRKATSRPPSVEYRRRLGEAGIPPSPAGACLLLRLRSLPHGHTIFDVLVENTYAGRVFRDAVRLRRVWRPLTPDEDFAVQAGELPSRQRAVVGVCRRARAVGSTTRAPPFAARRATLTGEIPQTPGSLARPRGLLTTSGTRQAPIGPSRPYPERIWPSWRNVGLVSSYGVGVE